MENVKKDWQLRLVEGHPRLFLAKADETRAASGYPQCGEGWHDLLERCCVRIEAALAGADAFKVEEIKAKYGTLRFYWDGRLSQRAKVLVEEAVALSEARSVCTCEVCGEVGRLYDDGRWLATACELHAVGAPVEIGSNYENLHIVRSAEKGSFGLLSCRRYDRELDAFIDVDPSSVGIEE